MWNLGCSRCRAKPCIAEECHTAKDSSHLPRQAWITHRGGERHSLYPSSVLSCEFHSEESINSMFGILQAEFPLSSHIQRMTSDSCLHLNLTAPLQPQLELSLLSHSSNHDTDLGCQLDSTWNHLSLKLLGIPIKDIVNRIFRGGKTHPRPGPQPLVEACLPSFSLARLSILLWGQPIAAVRTLGS